VSILNEWALDVLLSRHARVAVVGGPGMGKTSLVSKVGDRPLIRADDWKAEAWEAQPDRIRAACLTAGERFVVEGAQVARALRRGLEVDAVLVLERPKRELTERQAAMGKGVGTVLAEWRQGAIGAVVVTEGQAAGFVVGALLGAEKTEATQA
jgi:hypothetical protein